MDLLESIQLGTYDPIWRAITIFDGNISDFEKRNPSILRSLVILHENYHWLQLNTSSLGHLISLFPFFQKSTIGMYVNWDKENSSLPINKPIIASAQNGNSNRDKALLSDINAIGFANKFLVESFHTDDWQNNGHETNHALFAIYDMYLMHSKHLIVDIYGVKRYKELVELNKQFWDRQDNHRCMFYKKNVPLLGFRDLVECAARIVEINYYEDFLQKYNQINGDAKIDDEYLLNNPAYFQPLTYIQDIFPEDIKPTNMAYIFQFLLVAIHVSINPPTMPFLDSAWLPTISLNDIHPGIRFLRICIKVREIYASCVTAVKDPKLYLTICSSMSWPTDQVLSKSIANTYLSFYDKIRALDDGKSIISNTALYEFDFHLYKYYKYNLIKGANTGYFINPVKYITSEENMSVAIEVDNNIHCPVIFDTEINKFQVNTSGLNFDTLNEKGETSRIHSTMKQKTDILQQECINFLITGIFYKLDTQLLHNKGEFDLGIFDQIDAPDTLKADILQMYNKARRLNLTFA